MTQHKKLYFRVTIFALLAVFTAFILKHYIMTPLPKGFVYLSDIDPTIKQQMYYASDFNFVGKPIDGYNKSVAILTKEAAEALKLVQKEVKKDGFSLKVVDAYRPQRAVEHFWRWAQDDNDLKMKEIFYPNFADKKQLFDQGYILRHSNHSRGSTVDVTLVDSDGMEVDMGSQIDLFDTISNTMSPLINEQQKNNRLYLKAKMEANGFQNYPMEWWHYELVNEPFKRNPEDHFDFVVE